MMKIGLFGWLDKRLVQNEEDQDFAKQKLIDSDFASPSIITGLIGLYFLIKISSEFTFSMMFSILCRPFKKEDTEPLRGFSVRFAWFDFIKSVLTFDAPYLLFGRLHAFQVETRCEYDPETNRLDAVSCE